MYDLALGYELLQYGSTIRYEKRRAAELHPFPPGEGSPPWDHWLDLLSQCRTIDAVRAVVEEARSELSTWKCRPDPPPEGETFDELQDRIVEQGEGWTPQQVAMAFRCTPTLVRNTRVERERNPDTGREEGSIQHARELLAQGMPLRQVALATGIPRSTLHDALRGADRQKRV